MDDVLVLGSRKGGICRKVIDLQIFDGCYLQELSNSKRLQSELSKEKDAVSQVREELSREKALVGQVREDLSKEKTLVSQVRDELEKEKEVVSRLQEELETEKGGGKEDEEAVARLEDRLQQLEESRASMDKVCSL